MAVDKPFWYNSPSLSHIYMVDISMEKVQSAANAIIEGLLGNIKLVTKFCSILFILNVFGSYGQNVEVDTSVNVKHIYKTVVTSTLEPQTMRLTVNTKQSGNLVFLNCSDGSLVDRVVITTPVHCEKMFNENVNRIKADSLSSVFFKCIEDYYLQDSNHVKSDTLYILDEQAVFGYPKMSNEQRFFAIKAEIYNADTSEYTVSEFYSINELKGECISGGYFRNKSFKQWSNGKRNGVWKDFDKSGNLIQLVEYESDNIIRQENY